MSVARTHHTKDYTCMSNYHFKDKGLSLKAKGLLSLMLSLPEEWDFSVTGLTALSKDGETSVRSAVTELEELRYLKRTPIRQGGRIVDWEYDIFEKPLVENPQVEKPRVDNKDNKVSKQENTKKSNNNNTVNFLKSAGKPPKKKDLYSQCVSLIDAHTQDKELRKALNGFLMLQLEIYREKGKTFYINTWKNRLNKLDSQFKPEERLAVVLYSTEKGWQSFYPIPKYESSTQKTWEQGVRSETYTDEELQAEEQTIKEQLEKGEKVYF